MKTKRIVVKAGTSTLTNVDGKINLQRMEQLVRVLSDIQSKGHEVVLVTSAAITVGYSKMGLPARPKDLPAIQAAAAVGQCELVHMYDRLFNEYGRTAAQILLDATDLDDAERKQNLSNTFEALLTRGIIPIVNENDSVSHTEIRSKEKLFGDNDTLAALVALLCKANLLINLSDVDGLYAGDPKKDCNAHLISEVSEIDEHISALAGGAGSAGGTGGMITKLRAARLVTAYGIDMVITQGSRPKTLYDILEGAAVGTRFIGKQQAISRLERRAQ
ncbi:glutamate 5-kinase [Sporomusa aerivorans]|uniref:glutamate 5-kinase n=1 Tax=Sporomusa aerivorans TaxID=204936 RepID=UPI00352A5D06